ncbi:hypothetical protein [Pyxidicoccus xibeiensis]|uniref:hypothetical protein n=1 Tax=Pyxidicoccus xibeiensis TaxID=2906759 RepID=UPI0020A73AC3|nr:hypothetical protein [Pyxidicoccus xibeiensis]MCP3139130.1 hypothetical protein [Pyxidicoccus xibeiensis]
MGRLRITGPALALLALGACRDKELEQKQQEVAAAEKQLAEARSFREGLEREKALLSQKLSETRTQTDATVAAYHRTLAASSWLVEPDAEARLDGLDASLRSARAGFLLEEATRKKDAKALHALVSGLLASERPCVEVPKQESEEGEGEGDAEPESASSCDPSCDAEPYENSCEDVPERLSQWPDWNCETLARTGEGLPPAAFCRATFEHPEPSDARESPHAINYLPTSREVVRIAFEHGGKLYASDWPEPDVDLYHPPNTLGLARCEAANGELSCTHQCDLKFGRYEDPCACTPGDDPDDFDHSDDEEVGETNESPDVYQARRAAEAAEEEAADAQRRAEEAAQELSYQECVASCVPDTPMMSDSEAGDSGEPTPARMTRTARLEATPAPGIFVVAVDTRTLAADGKELLKVSTTHVLEHTVLRSVKGLKPNEAPPDAVKLSSLTEHLEFDDVLRQGGKVSLAPLSGLKEQGPMVVGLFTGRVVAVSFPTDPEKDAVEMWESSEVCAALEKEPARLPAAYKEACAKKPEPPPAPAVTAPADAGTDAKVAGEVTP